MKKFLEPEPEAVEDSASSGSLWLNRILGFLGSGVILWIALRAAGPFLASSWGIPWIVNPWIRTGIVAILAAFFAVVLTKIEGTIWARYYVIIGYLLSLTLIVWIVLRLLKYV